MQQSTFLLILGTLCTSLLSSALSVYVFHDVDRDRMGHLNEAFRALCGESLMFTIVFGAIVAVLTQLGNRLFHLSDYTPGSKLSCLLGIGVIVLQYPWDIAGRKLLPQFADSSLLVYLILAIFVCTAALLRDSYKQKQMAMRVGSGTTA
jgi:hypothetical protein